MVTTSANTTDENTGSSLLLTPQDPLSVVTSATSHSALLQSDQWLSPKGDTPSDDMVRKPIVTLLYQSMPVFPELTIMVVEKPKTKTHQSNTTDADTDNVTQTEPSRETPTGATVTKPSQYHTPESVIGKDKPSLKAVSTLPMVTPPRNILPPIKSVSQMVHGLGIKHD